VYSQLARPSIPARPQNTYFHTISERQWCQNMNTNSCSTKSKTRRKCKYPTGCTRKVCRACNVCLSHFEF
jgi:hypothetical protein